MCILMCITWSEGCAYAAAAAAAAALNSAGDAAESAPVPNEIGVGMRGYQEGDGEQGQGDEEGAGLGRG